MNADDLVTALPYLVVKAQIPRLEAQIMFIEAFHYSEDAGSILEVYLTNLKIARQRILDFRLHREPQSFVVEREISKSFNTPSTRVKETKEAK